MIFVFLLFTIISIVVFYCVGKHYQPYGGMPPILIFICIALVFIELTGLNVSLLVDTGSNTSALKYRSTISKEEFNINNYQEVKTTTEDNKAKISYTYKIKNADNCKTISTNDKNIYSISVSNSSSKVNYLTIKHNTYFNWATFTTTQKDEYVFSSK